MAATPNNASASVSSQLFSTSGADDQLFRRVTFYVSAALIAIIILIPLIKLADDDIKGSTPIPSRYVELLLEAAPEELEDATVAEPEPEDAEEEPELQEAAPEEEPAEPEPEPVEETETEEVPEEVLEEPTPEPEPEVQQDAREQAREEAEQSGIMTFADELADLRDLSDLADAQSSAPLIEASSDASSAESFSPSDTITSSAIQAGSTGIQGNREREVTSTKLVSRSTTRVKDPISGQALKTQQTQGNNPRAKAQGRSDEEIRLVFSRHQGSFYRHYNRALREDDSLQGKVVLKFTIAPNGRITSVEILESELDDEDLEAKILTKVRGMNFGAKDVPPVTTDFTLNFYPT
jgi:TonB family protein